MEDFVGSTTLMSPARLKELGVKSDLKGWVQTGSHITAIILTGTLLALTWGSYWAIPVFMVHGMLLNYLYAGQHELSHYTVFRNRNLNEFFGRFFGFLIIVPRDTDRFEHFEHHRHTQDPERDGELIGGKPYTLLSYVLYFLAVSYWADMITFVIGQALAGKGEAYLSPLQKKRVVNECRLHVAGYGLILALSLIFETWWVVILWLAPLLSMKWSHQLQNTIEHTGMPYVHDIMSNTRSIKTNRVMKWLAWNMPYHTAHHFYPAIPFHVLPQLHEDIVESAGHEPESIGYIEFQWHMLKKLIKEGRSDFTGQKVKTY